MIALSASQFLLISVGLMKLKPRASPLGALAFAASYLHHLSRQSLRLAARATTCTVQIGIAPLDSNAGL